MEIRFTDADGFDRHAAHADLAVLVVQREDIEGLRVGSIVERLLMLSDSRALSEGAGHLDGGEFLALDARKKLQKSFSSQRGQRLRIERGLVELSRFDLGCMRLRLRQSATVQVQCGSDSSAPR